MFTYRLLILGLWMLTEGHEKDFCRFSLWLRKINADLNLNLSDSIIGDFCLTIEDVRSKMSQQCIKIGESRPPSPE